MKNKNKKILECRFIQVYDTDFFGIRRVLLLIDGGVKIKDILKEELGFDAYIKRILKEQGEKTVIPMVIFSDYSEKQDYYIFSTMKSMINWLNEQPNTIIV